MSQGLRLSLIPLLVLCSPLAFGHDDDPKVLSPRPAKQGKGYRNGMVSDPGANAGNMNMGGGGFSSDGVTLMAWMPLSDFGGNAQSGADCWGYRGATADTPALDRFLSISANLDLTCGLRPDGSTTCWGIARQGQGTLAGGPYTAVATGGYNLCALNLAGEVECSPNVVTQGGRSE